MSRLYLVPIGEEWTERFERTVATPIDLTTQHPIEELSELSEARIWGTTKGEQKRIFFESMETGDPLLFYNEGEFFAAGRVGRSFENPQIGQWLWGNPDSRFVYTVKEFQAISVPRSDLNALLGYSDQYSPQGFVRVSEKATSNLLQQYASVEEAYQEIVSQNNETHTDIDSGSNTKQSEVREHTEIQWLLVRLGLKQNYDVYVAKNDQNLEYEGQRLAEGCVETLNLTGFSDAAMDIIEYVDVVWLDGDYIVKMFEVESTTSIYSGILRMTDFVVKVPNLAVDMYIAAPASDTDKVRREIGRPTFQHVLAPIKHCSLQYVSFEEVRNKHDTVEQAGPLQTVF
jgi:hypothetical protein